MLWRYCKWLCPALALVMIDWNLLLDQISLRPGLLHLDLPWQESCTLSFYSRLITHHHSLGSPLDNRALYIFCPMRRIPSLCARSGREKRRGGERTIDKPKCHAWLWDLYCDHKHMKIQLLTRGDSIMWIHYLFLKKVDLVDNWIIENGKRVIKRWAGNNEWW